MSEAVFARQGLEQQFDCNLRGMLKSTRKHVAVIRDQTCKVEFKGAIVLLLAAKRGNAKAGCPAYVGKKKRGFICECKLLPKSDPELGNIRFVVELPVRCLRGVRRFGAFCFSSKELRNVFYKMTSRIIHFIPKEVAEKKRIILTVS